jgi:nucleotide-binding universal stress UspA family protein
MNPRQILIPVDIHQCPLELFSFANGLAAQDVTVTLLHVVASNKSSANARGPEPILCLQRLERKFLSRQLDSRVSVRAGTPAEEILAEARQIGADLIVLTSFTSASEKELPSIAKTVIQQAACEVILLRVTTRLDCKDQQIWSGDTVAMKEPKQMPTPLNSQTPFKSAPRFLIPICSGGFLSWMLPAFLLSPS